LGVRLTETGGRDYRAQLRCAGRAGRQREARIIVPAGAPGQAWA